MAQCLSGKSKCNPKEITDWQVELTEKEDIFISEWNRSGKKTNSLLGNCHQKDALVVHKKIAKQVCDLCPNREYIKGKCILKNTSK